MAYQLWDLSMGNAIAEYDTEAAALALVRRTVEEFGSGEATPWGLTYTDDDGRERTVATGETLIERAADRPHVASD